MHATAHTNIQQAWHTQYNAGISWKDERKTDGGRMKNGSSAHAQSVGSTRRPRIRLKMAAYFGFAFQRNLYGIPHA
jgi:hypothetical protein